MSLMVSAAITRRRAGKQDQSLARSSWAKPERPPRRRESVGGGSARSSARDRPARQGSGARTAPCPEDAPPPPPGDPRQIPGGGGGSRRTGRAVRAGMGRLEGKRQAAARGPGAPPRPRRPQPKAPRGGAPGPERAAWGADGGCKRQAGIDTSERRALPVGQPGASEPWP